MVKVLDECEYTKEGDIYAFGMIVYELLTSERPFKKCTLKTLILHLSKGERPEIDSTMPDVYRSLIERCWCQEPSARPSFDPIVSDLRDNPDFITDLVDESEFIDYIDFIDAYETTYDSKKRILTYEEFIKNKKSKRLQEEDAEEVYKKYSKYFNGEEFPFDNKEAIHYCKLAADKGHTEAMFKYGLMLIEGRGVSVDATEPCRYYKMAADKGDIDAMEKYAYMLKKGRGVAVNKKEAAPNFK